MCCACVAILTISLFLGEVEEVIIEERDSLPLFDITDFPGVLELERVEDATSDAIYIPNGFVFGDEVVTTAFVSCRLYYSSLASHT